MISTPIRGEIVQQILLYFDRPLLMFTKYFSTKISKLHLGQFIWHFQRTMYFGYEKF